MINLIISSKRFYYNYCNDEHDKVIQILKKLRGVSNERQ